ncbi:MAG: hypothetical protein ACYSWW_12610 [Planctomycetota bacterium]
MARKYTPYLLASSVLLFLVLAAAVVTNCRRSSGSRDLEPRK